MGRLQSSPDAQPPFAWMHFETLPTTLQMDSVLTVAEARACVRRVFGAFGEFPRPHSSAPGSPGPRETANRGHCGLTAAVRRAPPGATGAPRCRLARAHAGMRPAMPATNYARTKS